MKFGSVRSCTNNSCGILIIQNLRAVVSLHDMSLLLSLYCESQTANKCIHVHCFVPSCPKPNQQHLFFFWPFPLFFDRFEKTLTMTFTSFSPMLMATIVTTTTMTITITLNPPNKRSYRASHQSRPTLFLSSQIIKTNGTCSRIQITFTCSFDNLLLLQKAKLHTMRCTENLWQKLNSNLI